MYFESEFHPLRFIDVTKDAIGCHESKIPSHILEIRINKAKLVSLSATRFHLIKLV